MADERQKQYVDIRRKLREILCVQSDEDYSVILWQPVETLPDDASYILVKTLDSDGKTVSCSDAAYEKGQFLNFFYDGTARIIDKQTILGWSYYPCDDRTWRCQ